MTTSLSQSHVFYHILSDLEGRFTDANLNYKNTFIASDQNLSTFNPSEHFDVTSLDQEYIAKQKILTGTSVSEIVSLKKKKITGEIIWTEWEFLPIFNEFHAITGVSCVGYNVPNYVENALEQSNYSQQIVNSFADSSSAQISLKDENLNYLSCNRQMANNLNLDKNEIYFKNDAHFYDAKAVKQIIESDRKAMLLESGKILHTQYQINNKFYSSEKFPVLLKNGLNGVGCITVDVTEKENFAREILRKETVLKNLTNNLNVSLVQFRMYDLKTIKWEFSSNETSNIIGITINEINNDPYIFHKMMTKEQIVILNNALFQSFTTQEPLNIEVLFLTKLNVYKWIEIIASATKQDDNSILFSGVFKDVTYRKNLEKEIINKEVFLKNLTDNINGVVTQFRTKNKVIVAWAFASRRITEIYELTFEMLQQNPSSIRDLIPTEELDVLLQKMYSSIDSMSPRTYQHTIKTQSGKKKWIEFTAFPQVDVDNSIIWYGFHQDITERKKLEAESKKNQNLLENITTNLNAVVSQFKIDKTGKQSWIYMSENALKLYEVSVKDITENSVLLTSMIHPDDLRQTHRWVDKSLKTQTPLYYVNRIITPSGNLKWIEINSYPQKQTDGSCIWNGFHLDVTHRKLLEKENIKNQKLLINLTNNIDGAIIQVRHLHLNEPVWEFVSSGIKQLFEITADYLIANPLAIRQMVVPQQQNQYKKEIETSFYNSTAIHFTMQIITPSGLQKWIRLKSTPTKQKNGSCLWYGFYEDVTETKLLEIENKTNQDLLTNLTNNIDAVLTQNKYIDFENPLWQYVSKGVEKLYEVSFADLKANPLLIRQMSNSECFTDFNTRMLSAKNLEKITFEYQVTTPSGLQKWVQTNVMPKFEEDKSVTVFAFHLDITTKKELENKIIANEHFLKSLTNNVNGMLTQLQVYNDNSVKWNFLSDGVEKLYGITSEEVSNNPLALFETISVEDYEKAKLHFLKCQKKNSFYFSQHRIVTKYGHEKWVEVNSTPSLQDDGSTIWNGFHHDITEQKKLELKNSQTQKQLDFIVNNTVAALILIEDNQIAYISKNYQTIFGFTIEEEMIVILDSLWKLVYFEDEREQIKKLAFAAVNKQEKNILLQYQYLHKNGKIIWRQDRINIFYNEQGRAIKIVDIVSDITKTKRLENLVHRKNEQLALQIVEKDKVTENYIAFQNNKWQEIAANLHDNISQLLFATNLHLSNFTNEHASYEKAKDILQIALNEIKYITQATKNLVIQDKGLQKALKEFIENNNYLNNIKITKIAHAEFYQHFSNSEQIILFTIIQEIIQNAIKHSQSTDVYLLLSFEDGKYSVKIIDNGVGMPADYTNGMGIYNIEKNIRLLNGSIKMYNDNGLTVEINLN